MTIMAEEFGEKSYFFSRAIQSKIFYFTPCATRKLTFEGVCTLQGTRGGYCLIPISTISA